jgi:YVTN family beta-propeller protein
VLIQARTKFYVAGGGTSEVLVNSGDTNQIFRRISTGIGTSSELAIGDLNNRIYVGADFSRILVLDGDTDQIVATIPMVEDPHHGIAVNPSTRRLYVANHLAQSIQVIDTADLTGIATIPLDGRPNSIAVDSNANLAYATVGGNRVLVIDGETNALIASIPLGVAASQLAI